MKPILKMTFFALLVMLGTAFLHEATAQNDYYEDDYYEQRGDVSYQTFYDELSPHGSWVEYPGYGYVWQPRLGNDFRPYSTGGHWVWSDRYEWVWVSDYDWGWAPFHYGRWMHDPYYGWLWVPGYEWSGAWVSWRDGGDYYGWAPLRPGISINMNFNMGSYSPPLDWWSFTPRRYILNRNIHNHCIDYRRNVTIIHHTTIINNYNYGDRYGFRTGPRRNEFERYTGRINPVQFRHSSRPGRTTFRDNEVNIYRPNVSRDNDREAPGTFNRYDRRNSNGTLRSGETGVSGNEGDNDFRDPNRDRERPAERLPRESNNERSFERRRVDPSREQEQDRIRNNPQDNRRIERNIPGNNGTQNPEISIPRQERPVRTVDRDNGIRQPRTASPRENQNNGNPSPGPRFRQQENPRSQPDQPVERRQPQPGRQFERREDNNSAGRQQGNAEQGANNPGTQGKRRF